MIEQEVANLFKKYFDAYTLSFEGADEKIKKLDKEERQRYLRVVSEFEKSGVLDNEIEELVRHFMKEIAFNLTDNTQITAYRVTLLFIQSFEKRMKFLASLYKTEHSKVENKEFL